MAIQAALNTVYIVRCREFESHPLRKMKKLIFTLLLLLSMSLAFAYTYPPAFKDLLYKFSEESLYVEIVTNQAVSRNDNVYNGKILLVADDYILFEDTRYGDKTIITINNIVTIATINK